MRFVEFKQGELKKKWKLKKVFKNSFFLKTNMRETWILKQLQIM